MNIFYLDRNLRTCAESYVDKHVCCMQKEAAQLLSAAHHVLGSAPDHIYKLTHVNHPCSIWVRQSIQHYDWLAELGLEICDEYYRRYGRKHSPPKVHASRATLEWLLDNQPALPDNGWTDPPQAMPEDCQGDDVIQAYRNYYLTHKRHLAKWQTKAPDWWIPSELDGKKV